MAEDAKAQPARMFTSQAAVLLLIAQNPLIRYHQIADLAGIAVKTAERAVFQLEAAGYISRKQSTSLSAAYTVHRDRRILDGAVTTTVGELLDLLGHRRCSSSTAAEDRRPALRHL